MGRSCCPGDLPAITFREIVLNVRAQVSLPSPISVERCPACGAKDYEIAGAVAQGFRSNVAGKTYDQPDYEIHDCSFCGLLFRTPRLSDSELSDFYARIDYRVWEIAGMHPTERAVNAHLRRLPAGSRLLDFGCSSGRLFASLVGDYPCCGIELNRDAAAVAAAKGLCILPDHAVDTEPSRSFDAVVMVDVFEHLMAPLDTLSKLVRLLRPNGILVLATGNGDWPTCRLDPGQFWYFRHFVHVCMLTACHAQFIAHSLSLRLEQYEPVTHDNVGLHEQVRQYLQHWAYWQFRRHTLLSQTVLRTIPLIRRAHSWTNAPSFSVGRDHVVAKFRKLGGI
jgi:SAM-dependent methyltransferase